MKAIDLRTLYVQLHELSKEEDWIPEVSSSLHVVLRWLSSLHLKQVLTEVRQEISLMTDDRIIETATRIKETQTRLREEQIRT